MRVGNGYDVHKFAEGRKLIIGGIEIPYEKGLLGHSDADVLTHAVIDALLGAAGEEDIGKHFPDTDSTYKDVSSLLLLTETGKILENKLYVIENIDATIVAQKPKLSPYLNNMKKKIAAALQIEEGRVNIKATTEEGLGFTGTGEGIKAYAVALINEVIDENYMSPCGGCKGCGQML